MKLWFRRNRKELNVRKRTLVDTIRLVSCSKKNIAKPPNRFFLVLATLIGIIVLFNFGFFGTVGASVVKDKAAALKMFQKGDYLVLFQNNSEMRPSGGFIGSFAIVTFNDYKITKIDFNTNIFKLDNAFTQGSQVTPPVQLAQVTQNHWALRDSNFSVDFPTATSDIQWFYEQETALSNEQETGQHVDGVIAVNASLIQDLLKLSGPIYLDKYQTTITSDNFFDTMAQKIEKEYFYDLKSQTENEPKTILKDMMPILMAKAFELPKTQLLKFVFNAMNQKLVLLQSNDQQIQQSILLNNWGGEIQNTASDYLAINNANITDLTQQKNGGAKTSLKVKESINYQVIQGDEGLVSDLTLTRSHTGSYAWPDGTNVNWTRILVPFGSTLISAEMNGKDITDQILVGSESGKTTFGLWINTNPQTSNVLKISYKLPFNQSNYGLLVQKQPGNLGDNLQVTFADKVLFSGILNTDQDIKPKK